MTITVEVCVTSAESALLAQNGGAHRVELCDNLIEGGTTPSIGAIRSARAALNISLHVIIRPRAGDFLYSNREFETMRFDIEAAKAAGADGVVIGILDRDGNIDTRRVKELVDIARPLAVTFHRAFDVTRDPHRSLDDLISLGIERVLTSGQQPDVVAGTDLIRGLVEHSAGSISIMACGGIDQSNVGRAIKETGVQEIHFAADHDVESEMSYQNPSVPMGSFSRSEYVRRETSEADVRSIIRAVGEACI